MQVKQVMVVFAIIVNESLRNLLKIKICSQELNTRVILKIIFLKIDYEFIYYCYLRLLENHFSWIGGKKINKMFYIKS